MLQEDGGDIEMIDFNQQTGELRVWLRGSCSDCPKSTQTLKQGIEWLLKYYVPEIKEIQSMNLYQE